jgi:nucleotide-binding universal stress UspA family protein
MARPILAGYDPRARDAAPAAFGVAAARRTGAPLVIASVLAETALDENSPYAALEELPARADDALEQLQAELDADDVQLELRELRGSSAARALHEAAEQEGAGLLVVGSTDRGAIGRVLPGSTADRLMHGAPCPVAVIPHGWQAGGGLESIGAAYTDTEEGRAALRAAHAVAGHSGAKLRVLTVVKVGASAYGETRAPRAGGVPGKDFAGVEGEHRVRAEAAIRELIADRAGDVDVEVDTYLEDPAETLIQVSRNLDLLVCGSRGYGPLRAVLLGGVSRRVAAEAHCPVIVLPRGVEAPLTDLLGEGAASA